MIYLLLSIISSTTIAIVFKFIDKHQVNTFKVIVVNYIVASILGYALTSTEITMKSVFYGQWIYFAVLIGILFIVMLYMVAISTQKAGLAVTTIAMRMAVIIPITFSIIFYHEKISFLKIIGIVIAIIAVLLSVYKDKSEKLNAKYIFLPLLIFIGAGLVDSMVKYSQDAYIDDAILPIFSAILFSVSGIIGLAITLFKKSEIKLLWNRKVLFWGLILGSANFGTVYFFVNALNKSGFDSSILFGINHIGIVALTIVIALVVFREKLNFINWIGIVFSIAAIYLLSKS